jgi:hypothetical protein
MYPAPPFPFVDAEAVQMARTSRSLKPISLFERNNESESSSKVRDGMMPSLYFYVFIYIYIYIYNAMNIYENKFDSFKF